MDVPRSRKCVNGFKNVEFRRYPTTKFFLKNCKKFKNLYFYNFWAIFENLNLRHHTQGKKLMHLDPNFIKIGRLERILENPNFYKIDLTCLIQKSRLWFSKIRSSRPILMKFGSKCINFLPWVWWRRLNFSKMTQKFQKSSFWNFLQFFWNLCSG